MVPGGMRASWVIVSLRWQLLHRTVVRRAVNLNGLTAHCIANADTTKPKDGECAGEETLASPFQQ
jgi:hypothetical protein